MVQRKPLPAASEAVYATLQGDIEGPDAGTNDRKVSGER